MPNFTEDVRGSMMSVESRRIALLRGARAELPILVGTAPFGLIYGVSAIGAGLPANAAQAMSAIIFAGSAQFVAAQLIGASIPPVVIIVTGVVINLRHALYSASIAPHVRSLNTGWKCLLAYLLTDEVYAISIINYHHSGLAKNKHWFFLGAGLALWLTWQVSTAVGIFLGAQVPASWSLDFALPLTFIAIAVPALKNRADVGAALAAGAIAIVAYNLPYKTGLVTAALAGIAAGLALESAFPPKVMRGHVS